MRLFKKLFSFFWDRSLLIFLIIGGLNTLVSMVGSQLLYGALGYWGATALMFTVCSVFSFIFNRKYSFESKAPLLQSAVRFSVVIAVCYLISFGLSDFLVPMFMGRFFPAVSTDWQARIAMLVAQVIFTACNYLCKKAFGPDIASRGKGFFRICNRRCRAGDGMACGLFAPRSVPSLPPRRTGSA